MARIGADIDVHEFIAGGSLDERSPKSGNVVFTPLDVDVEIEGEVLADGSLLLDDLPAIAMAGLQAEVHPGRGPLEYDPQMELFSLGHFTQSTPRVSDGIKARDSLHTGFIFRALCGKFAPAFGQSFDLNCPAHRRCIIFLKRV